MKKDTDNNQFSELRRRAQALLAAEPGKEDMPQQDFRKLIHELDTYQLELELQNEDLRNTQEELEKSRRRYADLYDFAPIAYITLSENGLILEANVTAGTMLGVARGTTAQPTVCFFYRQRRSGMCSTSSSKSR